jgi:hypothetical protein
MVKTIGVPKLLKCDESTVARFISFDSKENSITYECDGENTFRFIIPVFLLERDFTKELRPEPSQNIIKQGRWECAPASLAMLLDESLWDIKRALVHSGWNNDDYGCSTEQMIKASSLLGHEVYETKEAGNHPQVISLRSLNVKRSSHAIYWNGKEMLDPNWGFKGRLWWGCDWGPDVLNPSGKSLVKADSGCLKWERTFSRTSLKHIKRQILQILNETKQEENT